MSQPVVDISKQAIGFLDRLLSEATAKKLILKDNWHIDHLCYRVESLDRYQQMKATFDQMARLLAESDVNGRPIATYKLHQPIIYNQWQIDLIELPAPKPSKIAQEGFEHIEVVCDVPFGDLIAEHQGLDMDTSGLNKLFNQELEFKLSSGAMKFHHLSLESVVNLENRKEVWHSIQQLGILEELRPYGPLIAGTIPLGIDVPGSDVDILVDVRDLETFAVRAHKLYAKLPDFKLERGQTDGLASITINFNYQNIPFEIFAQGKPAIQQRAYRHFLIEERLLKLGGDTFKQKVIGTRARGIKTEPAFAEVLGLVGDPYLALLDLQSRP